MKLRFSSLKPPLTHASRKSADGGYVLLALILIVALLTIAAAAIAPSIAFQVKRDREEEMIHRGVQYSRAVQHYYKKFNRYPSRIEDLESTNKLRFLRKRYKDPISGKDFKLVYLSEVQVALAAGGGGVGGLTPAPTGGSAAGSQFANTFGGGNSPAAPASNTPSTSAAGSSPSDGGTPDQSAQGNTAAGANSPDAGSASTTGPDKLTGQTFGGGPIAGVVSTSKAQGIRAFNKKDHYNEWLFIYDPISDRGRLINTPYQPALLGAVPTGQPGSPGTPGASSGFGGQGIGNPTSPLGGGMQSAQPVQPQQQRPPN